MRKFIFALIALAIVSCKKPETNTEKYYTFTDSVGLTHAVTFAYPDNSSVAFILAEYKGKWKISENRIDNPPKDKTYNFIASPEAEYITVRIHSVYRGTPDKDAFMPERFYLKGGGTTNIVYHVRAETGTSGDVFEEPIAD